MDTSLHEFKGRVKFMGYSGRDHRSGAKTFFSKKEVGVDFFTKKIENSRNLSFSKKIHIFDQSLTLYSMYLLKIETILKILLASRLSEV